MYLIFINVRAIEKYGGIPTLRQPATRQKRGTDTSHIPNSWLW